MKSVLMRRWKLAVAALITAGLLVALSGCSPAEDRKGSMPAETAGSMSEGNAATEAVDGEAGSAAAADEGSAALAEKGEETMSESMERTIYIAGGCFWGTQKFFDQFKGVLSTEVGYANGKTENPTYQEVCRAGTGHAETVKVVYDESLISTEQLLAYYFMTIDPLSVNHQGGDWGEQYRTGIYYEDEDLLPAIQAAYDAEEAAVGEKLAVELGPLQNFYSAEDYHQKYLDKNPGGYCHIPEKLFHLESGE